MSVFLLLAGWTGSEWLSHAASLGTSVVYQGRLADSGAPANGRYDLRFALFTVDTGGNPAGNTLTNANVVVAGGLFSSSLDFGGAVFDGSAYWLEIGVRTNGTDSFTTLSPRQQIAPAPYAIRSLNATLADRATSAAQLADIPAGQFVRTTDPRLSDARLPAPGSSNYIQNTATLQFATTQPDSSFSIGGNGTLGFLFATKGVLGSNPEAGRNGVAGIGGDSGVYGFGANYGVSGQQNAITGPGAGVYGTTGSGGGYGVYGLVDSGTTNAGVYGKSIAMNGSGVLGQADSGVNASGVWGKAAQGKGVVG